MQTCCLCFTLDRKIMPIFLSAKWV
jgi:hypothetical protein